MGGASIHETAQVLAAAFQGGAVSGQIGAVSKLSRVMLLAPVVLALGWAARRRDGEPTCAKKRSRPGSAIPLGFIAAIGINSAAFCPHR